MVPQYQTSSHSFDVNADNDIKPPKSEILYEGYLYDVTSFMSRHPGGNIIRFYAQPGEDATLAIQQFHYRSMNKILKILKTFPKRTFQPSENENDARYFEMTRDFQKLHKELVDEGFFKPSYSHIVLRFFECLLLILVGIYLVTCPHPVVKIFGAVIIGLASARCGWFMHQGGHYSLTGNPKMDRFLQSFSMGIGPGISAAWWRSQHNRHHAMPQRLQHDVDLETLPLIAFNKRVLRNPTQDANFFVRNQTKLFLLCDSVIVFMFWRFFVAPRYALRKGAYLDLFFVAIHFLIATKFLSFPLYLLVSFVGGNYMLFNFALSHTHLPVSDKPRHWIEYCFCHTVDIQPSFWCDWFMGYLNYQIEHHLFPTMPQFRQRQVKDRVKALAEKHGLPYITMTYSEAVKQTFKNLHNVENFARKANDK